SGPSTTMQARNPNTSAAIGTGSPLGGCGLAASSTCWLPVLVLVADDGTGVRAPLTEAPGPVADRSVLVCDAPRTSPPGGVTPTSPSDVSTGTPVALAIARA